MVIQCGARVAGCVVGALLLLGWTQAARAQQPVGAPMEAGEGAGLGAAQGETPARVVYSLQEMPHVPTRSLDEMSAERLKPPGEFTRDYLIYFLGLAAAEELRAQDRALRQKNAGAAGVPGEDAGAEQIDAREFDAIDQVQELSGAPLGAVMGDQAN